MSRQDGSEPNAHLEEWAALLETDIDTERCVRRRSESDRIERSVE